MGKLKAGQAQDYRIQKDAMAEFGYDLKCACRGAYKLNDITAVWFPNLTQSGNDIANRGFGGYKKDGGAFLVEIAADDRRFQRILRNIENMGGGETYRRIAFPRNKGENYKFAGLYKFCRTDKSKLSVFWKRIATEINTDDYSAD